MLQHTTIFIIVNIIIIIIIVIIIIIIIITTTTTTTTINIIIIIIIIVTTTTIITIPTIIIINYYNCRSTLHWKRRKWSRCGGQGINRREDRKRGQECINTLFLVVSCCEPHWLCVLWAIALALCFVGDCNEPAGYV